MAYCFILDILRSTRARINFLRSSSPHLLPPRVLDDLLKLEKHIIRISEVFRDAEVRSSLDRSVELWLIELKEIAYYAEDLVDDCGYEVLRVKDETFHPVSKTIIPYELAIRLTELLEKFDQSVSVSVLKSMREVCDRPSIVTWRDDRPLISLPDCITGREHMRKKVTEFLLLRDNNTGFVSVLSIVGPAGFGKTTLAQLVYNDPTICDNFDLRGWANVSEDFCITTITRNILQSFTKKTCSLKDQTQLQKELMKELMGKSYFIVLDDVCHENVSLWECFLAPFHYAQSGKIIITARSTSTSKMVQSILQVSLECLNFEDSWSMFQKIAFGFPRYCFLDRSRFDIGRKIAAECGGVPLYIKAAARALRLACGVLNSKRLLERWREESGSSIDAGFLPLKMCYELMAIKLKQCFVFLSMYPRGHVFFKNTLVKFWMFVGLFEEKGKESEDVGSLVFDKLLQMALFQPAHGHYEINDGFFMHDLVHGFVRFVAGKEFSVVKHDCLHEISTDVRYLSIILPNSPKTVDLQPLEKCRHLRVLQILNQGNTWKYGGVKFTIPPEIFQQLKHLRCLILRDTQLETLPDSIGNLKLLQSLDLTNTRIERLPQSICRLYYLQILELTNCPLKELPKGIKSLVNLQILNFQKSFGLCMPHGIGNLTKLRTLPRFDVKRDGLHCALSELKGLVNLTEELLIAGLSNLTSLEEAKEACLDNKSHLEALTLDFSSEPSTPCFHSTQLGSTEIDASKELRYALDSNFQDQVLHVLQPHENLKELHIYKYGGSRFPSWLGDSSLIKLLNLSLIGGECGCKVLPTLGRLAYLRNLLIRSIPYVRFVGREFCSGDGPGTAFQSLETLEFRDMLNWSEWTGVVKNDFFSLHTLKLVDCPRLRVLPEPLSSSLIKLVIENCGLLKTLPTFPTLKRLSLSGEASEDVLRCLDQPSLTSLTVSNSGNIRSLHLNNAKIPLLDSLIVQKCINLRSIAGIRALGLLKIFKISACQNLQISVNEKIPGTLQSLCISNCPKLLNWKKIQYNKHYAQLNMHDDVNNEQLPIGNPIEIEPHEVQSHIRATDYKGKARIE